MPLYIRDDEVDALAVKVQAVTGARTKTDAVRIALQHEIERNRRRTPLRERLAAAKAIAQQIGPVDPAFDMKAFTDALWDGE
jgi:antitoxin VapB